VNDPGFWHTLMEISATMLGFIIVVMTMITQRTGKQELHVSEARSLMYASAGSFVMFVISLFLATFVSFNVKAVNTLKQVALLYFILGFLISMVIVFVIIYRWITEK